MGKALYRKYRSRSLDELIGQEHITTTLKNSLKRGTISHAYLLTGPRGVGKTSVARILAHEVNGLPYDENTTYLDIIEIDAASNRRIDEVRDLRDKVHIAPVAARYKVYIIDEVHMLTKEAFNALLKTLEEPPEHVIFILATTEAHKLPQTIVSRCIRFTFRPVQNDMVVAHLKKIAKQENIVITDEALALISEHGEGSFRDSISLLEQAGSLHKKIEESDIQRVIGLAPAPLLRELIQTFTSGNTQTLLHLLNSAQEQGIHPGQLAKQLGNSLKELLLKDKKPTEAAQIMRLLEKLIEVPASSDPQAKLEIILLEYQLENRPPATTPQQSPKPKTETTKQITEAHTTEEPPASRVPARAVKPSAPNSIPNNVLDLWAEVLATTKKHHNTLYGILRMASPNLEGTMLSLSFEFAFHQKRINEAKNRQLVITILRDLTGQTMELNCVVDKSAEPPALDTPTLPPTQHPKQNSQIDTISNIFGGAEVLDS